MVRLFIKENRSGFVHEYGSDRHDSFILSEDGTLHYYNLQNGGGTLHPENETADYSFCNEDGSEISFHPEDENFVNIGGSAQKIAHWIQKSPNPDLIRRLKSEGLFPDSVGDGSIYWECSGCGGRGMLHWRYCPRCGAYMNHVHIETMNHSFNVEIAERYGVHSAIIFQHLVLCIKNNEEKKTNFHDGCYWTFSSKRAFTEQFPYLSERQIRYAIDKLLSEGIIKTANYNKHSYDRTLWYALTEKGAKYSVD